jgi:hypothetical protein
VSVSLSFPLKHLLSVSVTFLYRVFPVSFCFFHQRICVRF